MKVTITRQGAGKIPYEVINNPLLAADKMTHDNDGVWYFCYFGKAENGIERMFNDAADIPDGVYELPDADWLIPDTVDEGVSDDEW